MEERLFPVLLSCCNQFGIKYQCASKDYLVRLWICSYCVFGKAVLKVLRAIQEIPNEMA